jgi:glucosylceramidase
LICLLVYLIYSTISLIRPSLIGCFIIRYDHNTDKPEYPQYVLDHTTVDTVAWHCYAGDPTVRWDPLTAFQQKNPGVKVTATRILQYAYCNTYTAIRISPIPTTAVHDACTHPYTAIYDSYTHAQQYMTECWTHLGTGEGFFELPAFIQGPIQHFASGSLAWTLGGSTKYDVGYPGGCGQCSGVIQVDMDEKKYILTEDYYKLGQFSKYVQSNATYLNSTGSHDYSDGTGVQLSAFLNPDGSRALVIVNKIKTPLTVQAIFSSDSWSGAIPARSVVTWVLPPSVPTPPTPPTPPMPPPPTPPTPPPLPAGCVFKKLCAASCSLPGGACSSICTGTYAGGACSCGTAKGCGGNCQTCPECGNCCCRI